MINGCGIGCRFGAGFLIFNLAIPVLFGAEGQHKPILIAENDDNADKKSAPRKKKQKTKSKKSSIDLDSEATSPSNSKKTTKSSEINSDYVAIESGNINIDTNSPLSGYLVKGAQIPSRHVDLNLNLLTGSLKGGSEEFAVSISYSGTKFAGAVAMPFSESLVAGGGLSYQSTTVKADFAGLSSSTSSSSQVFPFFGALNVSKSFNVGLAFSYNSDSSKSDRTSESYTYLTFAPAAGVHSGTYEASFSYQPQVTAQSKSSGDSEDEQASSTEKIIGSLLILHGRFLVSPGLFAGGGYEASDDKSSKDTSFQFEGGLKNASFQGTGGIQLSSTKATTDSGSASSSTLLLLRADLLDARGLPKFYGSFSYRMASQGDGESKLTGSLLIFGAGAKLFF
jgi:hypothetical protein